MKFNKKRFLSLITNRERILTSLLLILAACLPLLIKTIIFSKELNSLDFETYPLMISNFDVFFYYKAIFLISTSFFLIAALIARNKFHKSFELTAVFLFGFFVLTSSILSEFRGYTFLGGIESYQGCLVWLGYLIICLSASQIRQILNFRLIVIGILFSSSVLSLVGVLEYFNTDFHEGILNFFLSSGNHKVNYTPESGILSLSYNRNYYSILIYLGTIINLVLLLFSSNKKHKILLYITYVMMLINLFGTITLAADITYFLSLIVVLFFLRKKIKEHKQKLIIIGSINLVLFFMITNEYGAAIKVAESSARFNASTSNSSLKEVRVEGNLLVIEPFQLKPLYLRLDQKNVKFGSSDLFNDNLKIKNNKDTIFIENKGYEHYKFVFKKIKGFTSILLNYENLFDYTLVIKDGTFMAINPYTKKIEPIITSKKNDFFNKRTGILSGRGITWALALPVISEKTKLIGYGADSFRHAIPNKDFLSFIKVFGSNPRKLIAAHSIYLQIAIEFGVLALFLFLAIIFLYCYHTFRLLINLSFTKWSHYLSLGCFTSVFGFTMFGFTNSSMISSSVIFWMILGLGIAVNAYNKEVNINE